MAQKLARSRGARFVVAIGPLTVPVTRPKAVIVAVHFPRVDDREFESSLEELGRLVTTLGYRVVARVVQPRPHLEASAVIGEGKLQELAEIEDAADDFASGSALLIAHRADVTFCSVRIEAV